MKSAGRERGVGNCHAKEQEKRHQEGGGGLWLRKKGGDFCHRALDVVVVFVVELLLRYRNREAERQRAEGENGRGRRKGEQ